MYTERPRHPRAAVAVGLAILAVWLAGFSVALLTGDPADEHRSSPPVPRTVVSPVSR
jgi:hypothetical protein